MERAPAQVMQYLEEVEEAAEDVLSDKQQIIDLDRRRNKTREALRAVGKDNSKKTWVCMGNMFLKLPKANTKKFLQKDFDQLETEIHKIQKDLKPKVNRLRDLENKEELKGFNLEPLSQDDLRTIMDIS